MQSERYIAAADLGTSKIALSVAKITGEDVQIIYYRETPSDGVRYSCVYNPKRAAEPLRKAIQMAQDELNIKILQLVIGLPRYNVRQEVASARMERSNPDSCISREEVNTLKKMAIDDYPVADESKETIYGAVAQSFSADDELVCASESDVVGTVSDCLEGNFKIFLGSLKPLRNIDIMLNDVGVAPAYKFFLPNSVAQSVLNEEEKDNGVALVEIGAGVSSVTIYRGKILRHYSSIPFGGKNITADIRYECGFNEKLAENIKLAFGACVPDKLQSLSEKIIQINDDETGSYEQLPVKYLSEIIDARTREIIDAVLYQIQESGYADKLRNGIVVTGGGANLVNLPNLLKEMSGYNVRIGYPRTRTFSADGCDGIGEMSAAASIGMILEAKKDYRLNCIEDAPLAADNAREESQTATQEPENTQQAPEAEVHQGELFEGEILQPNRDENQKKKKDGKGRLTWKRLRDKVNNTFEGAFDNTLGNLFDSME
ncbi:MAG: cell division protein FtsA [Bacteroidales bacterium]|nr:cell division protein FtsA [Bacteroidales bacterium]